MRIHRAGDLIMAAGELQQTKPHAHHALQVVLRPQGDSGGLDVDGSEVSSGLTLVGSRVRHSLSMSAGALVLCPPESSLGRYWCQTHLSEHPFAHFSEVPSGEDLFSTVFDVLGTPAAPRSIDSRIRKVLQWLDECEERGRWADVDLDQATRHAQLSSSRFLHLFSEQVGSPWRTYLVWRRAVVALSLAAIGCSVTEAAYQAGYSDPSHMSRQSVQLFGLSPRALVDRSQFVQVPENDGA